DEAGNQTFGFFRPDYSPRKAATYLHNLTTVLADNGKLAEPGQLDFELINQTKTVHDLLLQHSNGTYQLIVWDERLRSEDHVTVRLGATHESVTIYDPTIGVEPVQTLTKVNSIDLTLSNHPRIMAITPPRP